MGKAKKKKGRPVKIRKTWRINPRPRVKKSATLYRRSSAKRNLSERLSEEL